MAPDEAANGLRLWMGAPEENKAGYEFASNLPIARNLVGRLLLIHGTSDLNAPFASTIRMIDALERADKAFDLIVLPEQDHSAQNSPYTLQAVRRYQNEHLINLQIRGRMRLCQPHHRRKTCLGRHPQRSARAESNSVWPPNTVTIHFC